MPLAKSFVSPKEEEEEEDILVFGCLLLMRCSQNKNFYSLKYNIDVDKVETHFALLKRTAKKNNVEIFRVTSGSRKMKSALDLLENAISNIESGFSIKNRMSCKYCEFYNTEHCR